VTHTGLLRALFLAAGLAGVYSGAEAADYDPAETRCFGGEDKTIERLLESLDRADQVFPNVPPEEALYLAAESGRAQSAGMQEDATKDSSHSVSSSIYSSLTSRHLYYVWVMRKDLVAARKALHEILQRDTGFVTYRASPDAEKLERATKAMFPLDSFGHSLTAAIERSSLPPDAATDWRLLAGQSLNGTLSRFISCKLAKVMGRQQFR